MLIALSLQIERSTHAMPRELNNDEQWERNAGRFGLNDDASADSIRSINQEHQEDTNSSLLLNNNNKNALYNPEAPLIEIDDSLDDEHADDNNNNAIEDYEEAAHAHSGKRKKLEDLRQKKIDIINNNKTKNNKKKNIEINSDYNKDNEAEEQVEYNDNIVDQRTHA